MMLIRRAAISVASRRPLHRILLPSCSATSIILPASSNNSTIATAPRTNWMAFQSLRPYSSSRNDPGASSGEQADPPDEPDPEEGQMTLYTDQQMVPFKVPDNLPDIPILALDGLPFFPGSIKKVTLKHNQELIELIKSKSQQRHPYVGVFVTKNQSSDHGETTVAINSISQLYTVGTFAQIVELREMDGPMDLILKACRRIRILQPIEPPPPQSGFTKLNQRRTKGNGEKKATIRERAAKAAAKEEPQKEAKEKPIIFARTENIVEHETELTQDIKVKMKAMINIIREIVSLNAIISQHIIMLMSPDWNIVENPVYLCDFVGAIAQNSKVDELQELMQETDVMRRLDLAMIIIEKERQCAKSMQDIRQGVEKKVHEQHRKFILTEQLKAIKRELGIEKDEKQALIEKMAERLKELKVPEYAMKVIEEEQSKLSFLDPHSSEFSITKNYLDWLTNIPWGKCSAEINDIKRARDVLEEDHYGMKDVKERILEFIAVAILKQKTSGKILCFHGPPGVGKTSIAKSIARALNREYYRFSVGGLTDEGEIKGHRRTYVAAMPGKLVQALKKVQVENPLILIDEIDKMGTLSHRGDPASALLEVLDPEQNANFLDHFLDVPIDLSKVLFICTANVVDRIPGPLKDRMELIELSGYVAEEKMTIAKTYLVPKCREKCALPEEKLVLGDEPINTLIRSYCRESGVRNLEKHIEKVFRKAAFRVVSEPDLPVPIEVTNDNLKEFVGREKFNTDRLYGDTPAGVIVGLAWTEMGGSIIYIESTLTRKMDQADAAAQPAPAGGQPPNMGALKSTGNLGNVMKESMETAYSVAKNVLYRREPQNDFLERAHIHVHVPEGGVPKDGPSAGCAIVSCLLSLALGRPTIQGVAMTGEISLTGKVLPIGGVKEKIIAAKRSGLNRVILPEDNKKDYDDLADFIKKDIEVDFVTHYDQIFDILFPA